MEPSKRHFLKGENYMVIEIKGTLDEGKRSKHGVLPQSGQSYKEAGWIELDQNK